MTTFAVVTFGCRVNQADSLGCEEAFLRRGATPAAAEVADVVVVNSCSVTATAEQGTRQVVRRVARANPGARIIVTGCYASRDAAAVSTLPGVTDVVPNTSKETLVARVVDGLTKPNPLTVGVFSSDAEGPCGSALLPGLGGRTAFTLRVQTGCDEVCSYCIIPKTRGPGQSRPLHVLQEQVRRIEAAGYREIVLTGVHLGSYGRDLVPRRSLAELLWTLGEQTHEVLFRVGSLEPMDCAGDVLDVLTRHPRMAPHLHLPLQHASSRVLAAMRRPYRLEYFAELVVTVRSRVPHASIGTDVIAGFPGETDTEAHALVQYLDGSPLTHVHVFPYSDRPGTDASAMPHKVPGADIRARAAALRDGSRRLTDAFHVRQRGQIRPALTVDDGSSVVTDNYLKVRIAPSRPRNERVRVRIDRIQPALEGSVLTPEPGP